MMAARTASPNLDVARCAYKWFRQADRVLLVAGAGMSIECGIDYGDKTIFAQRYPGLLQFGLTCSWQGISLMFDPDVPPKLCWGYYSDHANWMRYEVQPHDGYRQLWEMCKNKDYFVYTSNADGCFEKSGFDPAKIYLPQGDFAYLQCSKPCARDSFYPAKPYFDKMIPNIDKSTQMLRDDSLVPRCPKCNSMLRINGRGDHTFIHEPYLPIQLKLIEWMKESIAQRKRVLVIEFGVGSGSTPIVTRYPIESMLRDCGANGKFIRVNLTEAELPDGITGLSVKAGTRSFLQDFYEANLHPPTTAEEEEAENNALMHQATLPTASTISCSWEKILIQLRN
ncbi:NAD-dependent protein deacetylase of SIR2 family [Pelomyxa schiedti]|nr:NAD-dependent protein deacetylase of SIR2 family [Pelomyxa schiedti]